MIFVSGFCAFTKPRHNREIKKEFCILKTRLNKIKDAVLTLSEGVPEGIYLILFSLYITYFCSHYINVNNKEQFNQARLILFYSLVAMATCALIYSIIRNFHKVSYIAVIFYIAFTCLFVFACLKLIKTGMATPVLGIYFCLLAYKKDYRKILKCLFIIYTSVLIISAFGLFVGFTSEVGKPERTLHGYSFGTTYPNIWGHFVFLVLMVIWYLYLQDKTILSFVLFIGTGFFTY